MVAGPDAGATIIVLATTDLQLPTGSGAVKKGRHRRYEEARKFKRSHGDNLQGLIEEFDERDDYEKPEHAAWAEEFARAGLDSDADTADDEEQPSTSSREG